MKKLMLVLLIGFMLSMFLTACGPSDGVEFVYLPYEEGGLVKYLTIADGDSHNGVYLDQANKRIYCTKGTDAIIRLPDSMEDFTTEPSDLDISAKYICKLGQAGFDNDMAILGISAP